LASRSEQAERPRLTAEHVIAEGGWHRRYARIVAIATAGDYGLALVDGNGDGAELEDEIWTFSDGAWVGQSSSGAGPLDYLPALTSWWPVKNVCFAYGRAPGRSSVTLGLSGQQYHVPVGPRGVWAFVTVLTDPPRCDSPELVG
jgi:hypothetical protein